MAPYPDGGTSCDICTYNSCCTQEDACLGETPINEAGVTDCLTILGCYNQCFANTKDPVTCKSTCEGTADGGGDGGSHTQQGVMDFDALFTCAAANCAGPCNPSQEAGTQDAATE
jgi:hypothetical protein